MKLAGVLPNLTSLALVKFLPVTVTTVPPATDPKDGETSVTSGWGWISALSSISLPSKVPLGGTTDPSNGVGKIEA
ncbi:MAG: hypothetical protein ACJ76D_11655 [Solirubrobacterales bacterium]